MKKKVESYLKTSKNIYHTHALAELLDLEGAEGVGVFSVITHELSMSPNGIGYFKNLRTVAALIHRSVRFVEHIIRDYGLFHIKGDCFQSKLLCQTMVIESILDADNMEENSDETETTSKKMKRKPEKAVTASERIAINSERVAIKSERVATKQQQSRKVPPINPRTHDKDDKDNKYYKDNKKTIVADATKENEPSSPASDFLSVVEKVFNDEQWLRSIEDKTGLAVSTDRDIRRWAKDFYTGEIISGGFHEDAEGSSVQREKEHFRNMARQGSRTRRALDVTITAYRTQARNNTPQDIRFPAIGEGGRLIGYGSIREGKRYGYHGEPVDMEAPPCMDIDFVYDMGGHCWK